MCLPSRLAYHGASDRDRSGAGSHRGSCDRSKQACVGEPIGRRHPPVHSRSGQRLRPFASVPPGSVLVLAKGRYDVRLRMRNSRSRFRVRLFGGGCDLHTEPAEQLAFRGQAEVVRPAAPTARQGARGRNRFGHGRRCRVCGLASLWLVGVSLFRPSSCNLRFAAFQLDLAHVPSRSSCLG